MSQTVLKDSVGFDLPMQFIDLQAQRLRIADKLEARTKSVMEEGKFILGPEVQELEKELSAFCGSKYTLCCSDGTDALALGLMTKGVRPGDAIIVPSFTFASTAEVVAWLGATAIFADIDADTFNMDPQSVAKALDVAKEKGLRPVGVIPVDLFGLPADFDAIKKIADAEGLWIMNDSAQGFGGVNKGRTTGSLGDLTTTSFFPAKPLGCYGDGGAVFTNDADSIEMLRSLRVHGKGEDKYDNIRIGMNARLDTMQAAILLEKLAIYADEIEKRNVVADQYQSELSGVVKTPVVPDGYRSVWAQYTLTLNEGTDRAAFMAHMKEKGVPTVVYYPRPLHLQTAYKHFPSAGAIPVCEKVANHVVSLPMHPYLTPEQVTYVADSAKEFLTA